MTKIYKEFETNTDERSVIDCDRKYVSLITSPVIDLMEKTEWECEGWGRGRARRDRTLDGSIFFFFFFFDPSSKFIQVLRFTKNMQSCPKYMSSHSRR